jgi:hypothetical protein
MRLARSLLNLPSAGSKAHAKNGWISRYFEKVEYLNDVTLHDVILHQGGFMRSLMLLTAVLTICASAVASSITINNPSFETPVQCAGCFTYDSSTGWVSVGSVSTWRPVLGDGQYTSLPDGSQVAAIGEPGPGEISQDLTATVLANTTYTLTFWVGQRSDTPLSAYDVALLGGGSTLGSNSDGDPSPGTFIEQTIVYNSGPSPAELGQTLEITVSGTGEGQADFDLFSLDASPTGITSSTPEPSNFWLVLGSLGLVAWFRRAPFVTRSSITL